MAALQLNKNQKRKLGIFLKCVLFSFIAWALFAVSNNYIYTKTVGLEYINVPDNKAFHPLQSDTVRVRLEATGWQLLFSSLAGEDRTLQVDLSGLRNRDYILFTNQIGFVNRQFPSNQRVVSVVPDTLYFDFSRQTEKRVPVRVSHQLRFARQFGIIGELRTEPAYVTVRGPMEDVRKIEYWNTDTLRASGVNAPLELTASINNKQQPNLNVYPRHVSVYIPVGELTEKELELQVEVINDEAYRTVKLLPGKVRVTVQVSLNDYPRIGADAFRAVVDMKDWESHGVRTLPVRILRQPDFCTLVRIEPQNLDFFVNKLIR